MLNPEAVEHALRSMLADLDYDLHKYTECGEEDGTNHYPELTRTFILDYNSIVD